MMEFSTSTGDASEWWKRSIYLKKRNEEYDWDERKWYSNAMRTTSSHILQFKSPSQLPVLNMRSSTSSFLGSWGEAWDLLPPVP